MTESVLLFEPSLWSVIQVSDRDRLTFLHNQSTQSFRQRQPGEACETVLVTATARILDLAIAVIDVEAVWLLVSPSRQADLLQRLDRYIFFSDQVTVADADSTLAVLTLIGDSTRSLLQTVVADALPELTENQHAALAIAGQSVQWVNYSGLGLPGSLLLVPVSGLDAVQAALQAAGAQLATVEQWERLRIQQGRPAVDRELTEEYNPLEAGLWQTLSFDKGCYIGQETIARLNTYKGVKQRLYGLALTTLPSQLPAPLLLEGEKVGVLTSAIATATGAIGLGYLRTKAGGAGLTVDCEGQPAMVVDRPYLRHTYFEPESAGAAR
ncbi:YgfZ/GcvT domain-containing protein [Synechococcus elongatus]|uniref:CAF17-like 4Fe-4S cluster assembly/insertion protein YgfZ n=1 Tax=Synechococcus elongatus TaxID=32046 RepID=UPI001EDFAD80|nr:folate-binding protein [Synechococcus elongatus]